MNAFLGYGAIGQIRIVQAPVGAQTGGRRRPEPPLAPEAEARLAETIATVPNDDLRAALDRLGRGVLCRRRR